MTSRVWDAYVAFARTQILSTLQNGISIGCLDIQEGSDKYHFGDPGGGVVAEFEVVRKDFWGRVMLSHDLGFADAYITGDFTTGDLKAIMKLWIDNRDSLAGLSGVANNIVTYVSTRLIHYFGHSLKKSLAHCQLGYDPSNALFAAMLSEEMTYSSAIWADDEGGVRGDLEGARRPGDLEAAQARKIHTILTRARVGPGSRILEIGSGWGALSIAAAKMGCTVDTVTLSVNQKNLAEERIRSLNLQDKIRVHLLDYRSLPPAFEHAFDAFVSIEMIEAVGYKNLPKYFNIVDWALKRDRSTAVIVSSTQPENRHTMLQTTDYSRQYQWPNCFIPSATHMINTATQSTSGNLTMHSAEDFSTHYPRTLREWSRRMQENWAAKIAPALAIERPDVTDLEAYKRSWLFMFDYAESGYVKAYTTLHMFTFVRPENVLQACD
ncbi:CFS1-like protein [Exidia glandulosa HHB12029]|uniref:CFS1-like protein n=1 Tax=Exidia glandulosa HHB12029 TaxID=1314781 RepID=A0A165PL70_EXIGL|nr:CFS1-like protein [Exidia glandulosa HHB12029]